jgi:hypothetical protein
MRKRPANRARKSKERTDGTNAASNTRARRRVETPAENGDGRRADTMYDRLNSVTVYHEKRLPNVLG